MKTTHPFVFVVACLGCSGLGQLPVPDKPSEVEIPKDVAARIRTIRANEFEAQGNQLAGQIIKLKFSYRGTSIVDLKDGTHSGLLCQWGDLNSRKKNETFSGSVNVVIANAALPWLSKIPVNYDAKGSYTVIGRVEKKEGFGRSQVVLIGRELKTDLKGVRAVW